MKLSMHDRPTIPVPPAMRGKEAPPSKPDVRFRRERTHESVSETFMSLDRLAVAIVHYGAHR